jgi:pimeloyl-ACP methyl ester carboxylesterase
MMRSFALILSLCAAATLDWSAPAHAAPPPAAAEQRLDRVTIRSVGSGPAVVLIPGLASPPAVYDQVAAKIARNHRLIFVQVNGFAGSAPSAALDNLLPGAVDEIAGWLAANRIKKPAVIGHSMGGLMSMMLAKQHPEAAGRLLIVDALPFYGMLFGPTATPDAVRPIVEQMRSGLVSGSAPLAVPPHMSNSDAGKAKILAWLKSSDPKTVGEALVEDATTDMRPELTRLATVPVSVLYAVSAPANRAMTDALYQSAYKALPNAKLISVQNSEHFIMLDQPARFGQEVAAFLR